MKLTTHDHSRDVAGLRYVYPVVSRRSGGLSIGVNLNPNNACNWRCVYCQVPGLTRGAAPEIDLALLKQELSLFLRDLEQFFERFEVPVGAREIKDLAISGNGEPTSARNFAEIVDAVGDLRAAMVPNGSYVLISNGSLVHQKRVQRGLTALNRHRGQLWFKLDSATDEGQALFNNAGLGVAKHVRNLVIAAQLCPTWIQTCLFDFRGQGLRDSEASAYLELLRRLRSEAPIQGVMLYTLARPSQQGEAADLAELPEWQLKRFAAEIAALGYEVRVAY
ncbi:MAG: hypothetical protein U0271_43675 [Polyangiaceae bacterium]